MNLLKTVTLGLFAALLAIVSFAQPSPVSLTPLSGYFLSNRVPLEKRINCMAVTRQKDFYKIFGIAKTQTNTIHMPDFDKEIVLIVALPPTNKDASVKFISAIKAGYRIDVNIKVRRNIQPLTYTIQPVALTTIPKYPGISSIKFYNGRKLVEEVKLK